MTVTVDVVNRTRVPVTKDDVATLVAHVLDAEGITGAEIGVAFVGERRMRSLNRDHRGRDAVTDVLAFPLEAPGETATSCGAHPSDEAGPGPPRMLGDVVVCPRLALRQADRSGLPRAAELAVLLVHGTLHLLGYDHETDAGAMALRQAELLESVRWEGLLVSPR